MESVKAAPYEEFAGAVLELIRRTSTDLPPDVEAALKAARDSEEEGSTAQSILDTILTNVNMARQQQTPLCQDTGTPIFYVDYPFAESPIALTDVIRDAVAAATRRQFLRPNAVDPVTGENSGINLGDGFPVIHLHAWDKPHIRVQLMLKGGGCENVGAQYSLPDASLEAGRDLDGVKKAVIDCVIKAQGKGCPPGVLGVCIGGDRSSAYAESKRQLFRRLDDTNSDPVLADLEAELCQKANDLGIGPLGFSGKSTLLAVKIGKQHRLPASFFVTISYMCWEHRRRSLHFSHGGGFEIA